MRKIAGRALVLLMLAILATGCDNQRVAKLEEGVSTEADVRQQFGAPAQVSTEPDGSRIFEYPRQPEGYANYLITIGPDGKMSSLRQLLTEANFAKVAPGLDKGQVLKMLGKPAKTQFFQLKGEEVWDWRFRTNQLAKVFSVIYSGEGRVLRTGIADDPRDSTTH